MSGKARLGGLGRGLGALIPTEPRPESTQVSAADPADAPEQVDDPRAQVGDAPSGRPEPPTTTDGTTDGQPDGQPAEPGDEPPDSPRAQGTGLRDVPGARFAEVAIDAIVPNPRQPRQAFDADALAELAHSIREFGVLQPVVVRAAAPADGTEARYELVMGERRLRAAEAAGLTSVPAIVRSTDDDAMLRDALLENIHRAQLNPLEEAAAYHQLLEDFGTTHDELAQRIGRSRPQVSNTIRLLNLPVAVQRRVAAGVLSAGHARALLGLADGDQQDELAARIVAEGLSVRATEELVALAPGEPRTERKRRTPARRISAPAVLELADKLSDTFDTKVRVDLGRRKGRITVEFASIDDLERIVALMAPQLATPARPIGADRPDDGPRDAAGPDGGHSDGAAPSNGANRP